MEVLRPLLKPRKQFVDFVGLFFALTIIFGVAIFVLILYNAYNDNIKDNLADALTSSTPEDSSANVTLILEQTAGGISLFNALFPLLVVGVLGYVIMLVFLARSHPALFFIGLIVLGVALILAAVFSNVYEAIGDTPNFTDANDTLGIMAIIMENLPMIIFIFFIAIALILYALKQGPPTGGAY